MRDSADEHDEQSETNASTEEAEGGLDGPTKDVTSEPGGGDAKGPAPGGVPKEGRVDDDADTVTDGATDSQ